MVFQFLLGMMSGMVYQISPLVAGISQETFKLFPNLVPEKATLTEARRRGLIDDKEFFDMMSQLGFDKKRANLASLTEAQKLGATEILVKRRYDGVQIIDKVRQKQMTQEAADTALKKLDQNYLEEMEYIGFDKDTALDFFRLQQQLPTYQDVIDFAAKEVFEPESRKLYGLDEEFPKEFELYAEQIGIPKKLSRDLWAKHWDNPSPQQIYDIYHRFGDHRKDINEEDLKAVGLDPKKVTVSLDVIKNYFKLVEITPYWRDKLLAITFNPLTRVDVKRMFRLGILNRDDVYSAYLDEGYSPKNADLMTQFTVRDEFFDRIQNSQNEILTMLENGEIKRDVAISLMKETGATEEEVNFLLASLEYKIEKQKKEDQIDLLVVRFTKGVITEDQLSDELDKLNVPDTRKQLIIAKVDRTRALGVALPTIEDLKKWLKMNIVDTAKFEHWCVALGYPEEIINNYKLEILGKK